MHQPFKVDINRGGDVAVVSVPARVVSVASLVATLDPVSLDAVVATLDVDAADDAVESLSLLQDAAPTDSATAATNETYRLVGTVCRVLAGRALVFMSLPVVSR